MDRRRFLSVLGALAGAAALGWGALRATRGMNMNQAERVTSSWVALEQWLQASRPDVFRTLNPGASATDIQRLEAARGFTLPEGVKAFWQRHDGATSGAGRDTFPGDDAFFLETCFQLFSLAEIEQEWTSLINGAPSGSDVPDWVPSGVRKEWWANGWMPFAYNGAGDYVFIDLDPAPGGQVGQVLHFWHDLDEMPLLSRDFVAWFELVSENIRAGNDAWDDDEDDEDESY